MKPDATHKLALGILTALSLLFLPANATAQIPDEFTNLEILPKEISKGELVYWSTDSLVCRIIT